MSESSSGIGFLGMLTILFIGLKLGRVIDWTWFWVLSPIVIPFIIIGIVLIFIGAYYLGKGLYEIIEQRRRNKEWKRNQKYF